MSQQNSSKFREFLLLNLGILPVIIGVYFFKFPNNFSIGGVSGLSVVVAPFLPGISLIPGVRHQHGPLGGGLPDAGKGLRH